MWGLGLSGQSQSGIRLETVGRSPSMVSGFKMSND